jgi:hypothetical protein
MKDLKNIETSDLLKELEKRGFNTNLVFGRSDVELILSTINEERKREGDKPFVLSNEDKDSIIESLGYEWHTENLNEEIFNKIFEIGTEG